jgi:hypothetical protein
MVTKFTYLFLTVKIFRSSDRFVTGLHNSYIAVYSVVGKSVTSQNQVGTVDHDVDRTKHYLLLHSSFSKPTRRFFRGTRSGNIKASVCERLRAGRTARFLLCLSLPILSPFRFIHSTAFPSHSRIRLGSETYQVIYSLHRLILATSPWFLPIQLYFYFMISHRSVPWAAAR